MNYYIASILKLLFGIRQVIMYLENCENLMKNQ